MAATLGTINPARVDDTSHAGEKLRVFPFTAVADTNTWASGINGITRVAWESTAVTDIVAVTEASGTVTFNTAGATSLNGNLLVWSKGY